MGRKYINYKQLEERTSMAKKLNFGKNGIRALQIKFNGKQSNISKIFVKKIKIYEKRTQK